MHGGHDESMKKARFNLVLILWAPHAKTESDLTEIADRVMQINPSIRAFVVRHHKIDQLRLCHTWPEPTLTVSFFTITKRKLISGRFLTGRTLLKHGEYGRLDSAKIPVPRWTIVSPETRLDPAVWGPYVIEKPSAGRRGALVRIRRTSRIRYEAPNSFPTGHPGRDGPMLAQEFIYTGEWPTSYRVVTLFGRTLLCYRQVSRKHGSPLKGKWTFDVGGISVVSNTMDMEVEFSKDSDVIALAERAHREAFHDFPVLGFDIIRDAETGACYVLECHAQGSWLFSADTGVSIEAANGLDFKSQFGAIDKAAEVLAEETVSRAKVAWPRLWPGSAETIE
jgi:hypothetical protein